MKPEAKISKGIQDVMSQAGFNVWSTEQGFRKERGGTRTSPGIPDLIIAGHGRTLFVEVKTANGKLTDWQEFFQKLWTKNGGTSLVWRSADDAFDWLVGEGIIQETRVH